MTAWDLPSSLCVGGQEWSIRTDFRAVLDILKYFNDPEYEEDEKWEICLDILYENFSDMPPELWKEAAQKAIEFIDMGIKISIHTTARVVTAKATKRMPTTPPSISTSAQIITTKTS